MRWPTLQARRPYAPRTRHLHRSAATSGTAAWRSSSSGHGRLERSAHPIGAPMSQSGRALHGKAHPEPAVSTFPECVRVDSPGNCWTAAAIPWRVPQAEPLCGGRRRPWWNGRTSACTVRRRRACGCSRCRRRRNGRTSACTVQQRGKGAGPSPLRLAGPLPSTAPCGSRQGTTPRQVSTGRRFRRIARLRAQNRQMRPLVSYSAPPQRGYAGRRGGAARSRG